MLNMRFLFLLIMKHFQKTYELVFTPIRQTSKLVKNLTSASALYALTLKLKLGI
jgi:hypothetical protein